MANDQIAGFLFADDIFFKYFVNIILNRTRPVLHKYLFVYI